MLKMFTIAYNLQCTMLIIAIIVSANNVDTVYNVDKVDNVDNVDKLTMLTS